MTMREPHDRARSQQAIRALSVSDAEFSTFRRLIQRVAGINLTESKRQLLCSRLAKRLRHHRLGTLSEYYSYLKKHDSDGSELREMVNCITTNKTHFFREAHHFEFLVERLLPEIERHAGPSRTRRLRIWSAGCSTGEEPYSIAMTLAERLRPRPLWDVKILASDIDTDVLSEAEEGVYASDRLDELSADERERWFEPVARDAGRLRVRDELRESLIFRRINLVDEPWPIKTQFDVIFCRNVTIYFDRPTQQRLYDRFVRILRPGGYLIAGHSENLTWLSRELSPIGRTVYQLRGKPGAASRRSAPPPRAATPSQRAPEARRALTLGEPRARRRQESSDAESTRAVRELRLMSGGVHASRAPTVVRTLLGSCVAVCLHDPVSGVGGMNHFMLPDAAPGSVASTAHGVNAMELLVNELMTLGGQRQRMIARVFGAAHLLKDSQLDIPRANGRFALEFLAREGMTVVEKRLGGEQPLHVTFFTHTGEATVRAVGEDRERAAENDQRHARELQRHLSEPDPSRAVIF